MTFLSFFRAGQIPDATSIGSTGSPTLNVSARTKSRHILPHKSLIWLAHIVPMPLCSICRSIPYRKVIQGHESLYDLTYNNGSIYRVRSYNSFTELFSSGLSCELCCIVSRSIQTSVSYQGYLSDEDKCQPVWLCLRFGGSPAGEIQVYVGSNEPEIMVFGKKLRILTTLGTPSLPTFLSTS